MTLTVTQATNHISDTLGGSLSSNLTALGIINEAGRHLCSMHEWNWLARPGYHLSFRAPIEITTGIWTVATKTLTETGAFTDYTFLNGDVYEATGGSATTEGFYRIASRTNANSIVLETAPSANNQTDFTGSIILGGVVLPSDFAEVISIHATNSLVSALQPTSIDYINQLRTNSVFVGAWIRWYAINWGADVTTAGGSPSPRLEVYPVPTAAGADELTLFYRAGWQEVSGSSTNIPVPPWMESFYIQVLRAFARGYEEEDVMPLTKRLDILRTSSMFDELKRRDGNQQTNLGPMRGGAVDREIPSGSSKFLRTSVQGPS